MSRDSARAHLDAFPLFCEWICELQPGIPLEEIKITTWDKLTAILVRQLRQTGFWEPEDLADCRNNILLLMERKLLGPIRVELRAVRCAATLFRSLALNPTVLHLLRAEEFSITVSHPDIRPSNRIHVRLRDLDDDHEIAAISNLKSQEKKSLPIRFAYDLLAHNQNIFVVVDAEDESGNSYCASVRAVRHESLSIRMGYLVAMTRRLVLESRRGRENVSVVTALEDLGPERGPTNLDDAHDAALLSVARAVKRLPALRRKQLIERYVDGLPWEQIAARHNVTVAKVRQDNSRLMRNLATPFVALKPSIGEKAVPRVVKWVKEMLPRILEQE